MVLIKSRANKLDFHCGPYAINAGYVSPSKFVVGVCLWDRFVHHYGFVDSNRNTP